MNYLTEIKLFNDWLETEDIPSNAIVLWYALMFTANRSGWPNELTISIAALQVRSKLSRSSIRRMRNILVHHGLISVESRGGNHSTIYRINSFEVHIATHVEPQNGLQAAQQFQIAVHPAVHGEPFNRLNRVINPEKEKTSKKEKAAEERKERKSCAKKRETPRLNQARFLSTLDAPWQEVMAAWLEYKRTRRESYRSELGATKCLTLLRNLSGDSAAVAAAIIDQSIANNWAGLFPLRTGSAAVSVRGQHPGQIIHPASDERTRHLLEKFSRK